MVEVFITDIRNKNQADKILSLIQNENAALKISFDLNETDYPFPCGHTILRIEADEIKSENILEIVTNLGFRCAILDDAICIQNDTL
ncbi:MAG TPA: hypothetical protein PLL09_00595 [Flavobacterium sp.]|uniref:hypothetical protein n=1 Tax=unclassified Flavobacterium TaxID=196869 RepID=UPI0025BD11A5|nr:MULTISPECIES: hypothetical protein [unclassified Flavobacterium]HRE76298.1 hypothetical protein [Flavobacterium sp.]